MAQSSSLYCSAESNFASVTFELFMVALSKRANTDKLLNAKYNTLLQTINGKTIAEVTFGWWNVSIILSSFF